VKTELRTIYIAHDGSEFATEALCRTYERRNCGAALVGLSEDQIAAARSRQDIWLADAIEAFAYEISKCRKASGQLKRRPMRETTSEAPADGPSD
jgi:hypothetical protein